MSHDHLVAWRPLILSVLRAVTGPILPPSWNAKAAWVPARRACDSGVQPVLVCRHHRTLLRRPDLVGPFTRSAAFLAPGLMAFACWIAHASRDLFPVNNGGDAAIHYCFVFLYLVFAGPGPWSLDTVRGRHDERA